MTGCVIDNKDWIETLPQDVSDSILWKAEMEEGNLNEWNDKGFEYPGGGVFNTGGDEVTADVSSEIAHSGEYSAYAEINNAYRAENGNRAVRYMRWTNKAWDDGGEYFPDSAYYSVWVYFPDTYNPNKYEPWDPGDGGWWNVFQFKSNDSEDVSQPIWTLNISYDEDEDMMYFYLRSKYNTPSTYLQENKLYLPAKEWTHIEAFYKQSPDEDGHIIIWQNGNKIFEVDNVQTILAQNSTWGVGNYTDHVVGGDKEGSATIYYDDAIVSTKATNPHSN